MALTSQYPLAQNKKVTLDHPSPLYAVGGDNATGFYLFFPGMPAGMQWVFPFVYGFLYPLPTPQPLGFLVDASQRPAGAQAPAATTGIAQLTAYGPSAVPYAFSPGTPATGSTTVRWNINALPADGVQATITRAASPGVTHVADSFHLKWVNDSAAAAGVLIQASIRDGASGAGALLDTVLYILGATGTFDGFPRGPGLNYRGTAGLAMTGELSVGVALTRQSVSLSGYDV